MSTSSPLLLTAPSPTSTPSSGLCRITPSGPTISLTPSCTLGGSSKKIKQTNEIDVMKLDLDKLYSIPSHHVNDSCMDFVKMVGHELKDMTDVQRKLAKKYLTTLFISVIWDC